MFALWKYFNAFDGYPDQTDHGKLAMTNSTETNQTVATYSEASPELFGLESERMAQVSGILGRLWGDSNHAPANIAGLALILIFAFGAVVMFFPASMTVAEYWKIVAPILTLILGYLFGKKS